jgi:hypothetical protein
VIAKFTALMSNAARSAVMTNLRNDISDMRFPRMPISILLHRSVFIGGSCLTALQAPRHIKLALRRRSIRSAWPTGYLDCGVSSLHNRRVQRELRQPPCSHGASTAACSRGCRHFRGTLNPEVAMRYSRAAAFFNQ